MKLSSKRSFATSQFLVFLRRLKIKNQSHEGLVQKKNIKAWLMTWLTLADEVKLPVKMYWIFCPFVSPRARESMTVLDSGFHAVDSGFQVYWIPVFLIGTFL